MAWTMTRGNNGRFSVLCLNITLTVRGPRVFFLSGKLLQLARYIEPESQRNDAFVITDNQLP